ncbi:MAG: aminoglycoside phosphotransferase family protein [Candidatus Promineofilum sp.]|nr:aminoglycoside phosphotransferase family protein [Promineifilum sp.]
MLEKPDLPDKQIMTCLRADYGLPVASIEFLPLGADANTAVYRAVTGEGTPYFVKLRSGAFDASSVAVPRYLSDQGIQPIIAPQATRAGRLWAELDGYRVILYPFVEGRNGYEIEMSARQWRALGAALRRIHDTALPPDLAAGVRQETYSARWREAVREFLEQAARETYTDPVAIELAAFLNEKRTAIAALVDLSERHAATLQARPGAFVLCHSDLHAGNVLIDAGRRLYIVDWDQPIFAPRERDLMYPGGAQGFRGHTPPEEERLFHVGYGRAAVDAVALAYYRAERIVEDIALYCTDLLLSEAGGADRAQSLHYLKSNFEAGGTIEAAYRARD